MHYEFVKFIINYLKDIIVSIFKAEIKARSQEKYVYYIENTLPKKKYKYFTNDTLYKNVAWIV